MIIKELEELMLIELIQDRVNLNIWQLLIVINVAQNGPYLHQYLLNIYFLRFGKDLCLGMAIEYGLVRKNFFIQIIWPIGD